MKSRQSEEYVALTQTRDTVAAVKQLRELLERTGDERTRLVAWRGDSGVFKVYWHDRGQFWSRVKLATEAGRSWCAFGAQDPDRRRVLYITLEVNIVRQGSNWRCGGAIVRDKRGWLYLAHSGKVGGGRKGIGKGAFLKFYRGAQQVTVYYPDRETERRMFVLDRLDAPDFGAGLGAYVNAVQRFKDKASREDESKQERRRIRQREAEKKQEEERLTGFNPETHGYADRPAAKKTRIRRWHGRVVNALHGILAKRHRVLRKERATKYKNDRRDLVELSPSGRVLAIYEIKTCVDSYSLYTGVGQLALHGAKLTPTPRRVLVIRGRPAGEFALALKRLGIRVLQYRWRSNGQPKFVNLDEVLA